MLDLREPKLQLFVLAARDEPEVPENAREPGAGRFAEPHGVAAPARRQLLDQRPRLVARHAPALREELGERVDALRRQRDRTEAREQEALDELAQRVSAGGHAVAPAVAAVSARASPGPTRRPPESRRRATGPAARRRPGWPPRAAPARTRRPVRRGPGA